MLKLLKQQWPLEKLNMAFEQLGLSPQIRAEAVALEQFAVGQRRGGVQGLARECLAAYGGDAAGGQFGILGLDAKRLPRYDDRTRTDTIGARSDHWLEA